MSFPTSILLPTPVIISAMSGSSMSPKRGVGLGTVREDSEFCSQSKCVSFRSLLTDYDFTCQGKAAQAVFDFANLILNLRERLDELTVTELVEWCLKRLVTPEQLVVQATLESQARIENIEEFLSVTKNFDENP